MIDEELMPMAFVFVVMIIFLCIALYSNFICQEYVNEADIIERLTIREDYGRLDHIHIEEVDYDSGSINLVKFKKNKDKIKQINNELELLNGLNIKKQNTIYIDGPIDLLNEITNDSLIRLDGNDIYTIDIFEPFEPGKKLNIWNNSSTVKNLKSLTKFIIDGVEKTFMFTLKPGKFVSFQNIDKLWVALTPTNFSDNKEMIMKYITNKVKIVIESFYVKLYIQCDSIRLNSNDLLECIGDVYNPKNDNSINFSKDDINIINWQRSIIIKYIENDINLLNSVGLKNNIFKMKESLNFIIQETVKDKYFDMKTKFNNIHIIISKFKTCFELDKDL